MVKVGKARKHIHMRSKCLPRMSVTACTHLRKPHECLTHIAQQRQKEYVCLFMSTRNVVVVMLGVVGMGKKPGGGRREEGWRGGGEEGCYPLKL